MPIKFQCPSCKRPILAQDAQAGKKGVCPGCKKGLFIPLPAMGGQIVPKLSPSQGPQRPQPKPPPPVDVEAQAAALLSGEEAKGPAEAPATIDFACPACDAELHLSLDLAGKKTSCPVCTRIIAVPQPAKRDDKNWRQKNAAVPSLAKKSDEPAPEGAWSSTATTGVSREALLEAKVVQKRKKPRTPMQKYAIPVLLGTVLIGGTVGYFVMSKDREEDHELEFLQKALDYAAPENFQLNDKAMASLREANLPQAVLTKLDALKDKELDKKAFLKGLSDRLKKEELDKFERIVVVHAAVAVKDDLAPAAQAALFLAGGDYHRRSNKSDSATRARELYGRALNTLATATREYDTERNLGLLDVALAQVELGGETNEIEQGQRVKWDEVLKSLRATLSAVRGADAAKQTEARMFILRAVVRRLIAPGQNERVLTLVRQLYGGADPERCEALAAVGVELLAAGDTARAEQVADQSLAAYAVRGSAAPVNPAGPDAPRASRAVVRPTVVALAVVLGKKKPETNKAAGEDVQLYLGEIEGLARQGKWDKAREKARKEDQGIVNRFRADAAIALVAAEVGTGAVEALNDAVDFLAGVRTRDELNWLLLRLTEVGLAVGLDADRLDKLIAAIPDLRLRGRARLLQLQAQSQHGTPLSEEVIAAMPDSIARLLAWEALARVGTRRDRDWGKSIADWEQPRRAFASAGVALGLQDHALGK